MPSISERLVDLANEIRFENLPAEVVRESGRRLLDALGCMIAGARGSTTVQVAEAVAGLGGAAESSLLGMNSLTSCEKAALVNCTALRFLDYMDGHPGPYPCHPCFNIPPILAVAEKMKASGSELVTAIVRAYEIMPRFQENAGLPDLGARGWAGSTNLAFIGSTGNRASTWAGPRPNGECARHIDYTRKRARRGESRTDAASKSILDGMTAMNAIVATSACPSGSDRPA